MQIHVCTHTYTCKHITHIHMHVSVHAHAYIHMCVHKYMHIHALICACMHIHARVHMYICIHASYINIYAYTLTANDTWAATAMTMAVSLWRGEKLCLPQENCHEDERETATVAIFLPGSGQRCSSQGGGYEVCIHRLPFASYVASNMLKQAYRFY